jgi:hypothetical protein
MSSIIGPMTRVTSPAAVVLVVAALQPSTRAEDQADKLVDGWCGMESAGAR